MAMFDFSKIAFFDNHTHTYELEKRDLVPMDMADTFMHGLADEYAPEVFDAVKDGTNDLIFYRNDYGSWRACSDNFAKLCSAGGASISDRELNTIHNLGVVKVLINNLAEFFHCEPTFEAVSAARNKLLQEITLKEYAERLYKDQNIIGTVLDDAAPPHSDSLCFPCTIYRLFQIDPLYFDLLQECKTFAELKQKYVEKITWMITDGGFSAFKSHPLEICVHPMHKVTDEQAEKALAGAKAGKLEDGEDVYCAIYGATMEVCQKLDVSLHLHTGGTGESLTQHTRLHPYFMGDLLACPEYIGTKIVFLHAAFPWSREVGLMAHTYPNLYVDMGWTLPWNSLNIRQILRDLIGVAPLNKIMLGTGQHNIPEVAWLAAKVAKRALADIMEEYVSQGLLSKEQAQETAEQILYKNACELYKVK